MSRVTAIFTATGLLGLVIAMLSALGQQPGPAVMMPGVAMVGTGFLGAVIGAVVELRLAAQTSR
ncbi:hypothetical protein [Ruegeria arenilitoris]|uniref:hypothetical protein n=1 Tax=Ruegeria arenilitoris TaxID=1173585 RepID=UPI00148039C9|nr:hypothetical protein [Ruegeria arenilitoris]